MIVYLSKSNACDPEVYMRVRKYFDSLDCDVKEFRGGEYSNADVLASDMLVVLPPVIENSFGDIAVGRGQYTQVLDFFNKNYTIRRKSTTGLNTYEPIDEKLALVISHIDKETGSIYVDEIKGLTKTEDNWKTDWGSLYHYDMQMNITNYIGLSKYKDKLPIRGDAGFGKTGVIPYDTSGGMSSNIPDTSSTPKVVKPHLACITLFK